MANGKTWEPSMFGELTSDYRAKAADFVQENIEAAERIAAHRWASCTHRHRKQLEALGHL